MWVIKINSISELTNEEKKKEQVLQDIADCIRERVPFNGIMPSESLYEPTDETKVSINFLSVLTTTQKLYRKNEKIHFTLMNFFMMMTKSLI